MSTLTHEDNVALARVYPSYAMRDAVRFDDSNEYGAMLARVRLRAGQYTHEVPTLVSLLRVERIYNKTVRERLTEVYGAGDLA